MQATPSTHITGSSFPSPNQKLTHRESVYLPAPIEAASGGCTPGKLAYTCFSPTSGEARESVHVGKRRGERGCCAEIVPAAASAARGGSLVHGCTADGWLSCDTDN